MIHTHEIGEVVEDEVGDFGERARPKCGVHTQCSMVNAHSMPNAILTNNNATPHDDAHIPSERSLANAATSFIIL